MLQIYSFNVLSTEIRLDPSFSAFAVCPSPHSNSPMFLFSLLQPPTDIPIHYFYYCLLLFIDIYCVFQKIYIIRVSNGEKEWKISRRYNQFYQLDLKVFAFVYFLFFLPFSAKLREVFPKERIPRVPPKHYIRSGTSRELINERKALLQQYLDELAQTTCVTNWPEFSQWLDSSNDVCATRFYYYYMVLTFL